MTQLHYTYTVTGNSLFPFDMLRYDRCTPKTETDSAAIERTARVREHDHRVTLEGPKPPTTDRWRSFGWDVATEPRTAEPRRSRR